MLEIISEIIDAEKKAQGIVDEAKKEASQRKQQNEEALQKKLNDARDQAREEANARIADSRKKADERKNAARSSAGLRLDSFLSDNRNEVESIIGEIVELVITPEHERE